jgi:hypothetical protein
VVINLLLTKQELLILAEAVVVLDTLALLRSQKINQVEMVVLVLS